MNNTTAAGSLVLVVDDDPRNRKLARDVLEAAGFCVLEAATGAEGIAAADEHLPDVVLMDLRLPDMDGTAAARELADGARTSSIPVVALTALALEEVGGFAGYLAKPIDVETFPARVKSYCRA